MGGDPEVMRKNWRAWVNRPVMWALLLALLDLLWLLGLHVAAWSRPTDGIVSVDAWWSIADSAMQLWNSVHLPVRRLVEPILFPVVTSHPLSPSDAVFILYEALCLLQSVFIGYVVGLLIRAVLQRRR